MKRYLLLLLSLFTLLTACQTFDLNPASAVSYNDLLLSSDGQAVELPGSAIQSARLLVDPTDDGYKIIIVLTKEGTAVFARVTERAAGRQLSISASGKSILSATIVAPIWDGRLTVTGYKREEATRIIDALIKKP